ncbi:MAG: YggT family protein [Demequina sp.]|uniref:YggT family protein n=1 Tax=Demequina sp. TaxID=2050685 RepID=UPI0019CBDDD2|nr:YggT family protein [Demequina sp.]MBC7298036.1 YggT family protein [Demequina sp.]
MTIRPAIVRIVDILFSIVGIFLLLRFALKLFGANAGVGFVSWLYEMTAVLLEPFRGIFPTTTFENQYVLEFSTLFAILAYGLAYALIVALLDALTPTPRRTDTNPTSRDTTPS